MPSTNNCNSNGPSSASTEQPQTNSNVNSNGPKATNVTSNNTNTTPASGHWPENVGILAIEMYFPNQFVDQTELEAFDGVSQGKYTIGLGQTRMGFAEDVEDIQSICLTAVQRLFEQAGVCPSQIGFLMVGTETIIDKSKSVKTTLMQLFEQSGNTEVEGLDTTNACYGGTAALFHAINWVESSSWDGRYALVVCGDLAVYASGNARPTGGAGACAMLVGPNAPLAFVRGVRATTMSNVYDFYKPDLNSEYPVVDGKLSISCYLQAVDICYRRLRQRLAQRSLDDHLDLSYFNGLIFHSPFCKLVQKSVGRLAYNEFLLDDKPDYENKYKGAEQLRNISQEESYASRELEKYFVDFSKKIFEEKTKPSLLLATQVGNMYTASVYSCLVSHLISKPSTELAGQRLLMFSYGSGMAASMYVLSVSNDCSTGSPLHRLLSGIQHVQKTLDSRIKIAPTEFVEILDHKEKTHHLAPFKPTGRLDRLRPGTFYLTNIDDKYRRSYDRIPLATSTSHPSNGQKQA